MRKILLFLSVLLVLSLCACSPESSASYTVEKNWGTLTVDTENHTISSGGNTYRYSSTGGSSHYRVEIIYPDGSAWYQESVDGISHSIGWSDDYDPGSGKYLGGDVLFEAIREKAQAKWKSPLPSLLLLCAGIFSLASPRSVWYLGYGWHFKDSEPSDLALFANRAAGAVAIIAAVIIFLI